MRHYECECLVCHGISQCDFYAEPYPAYGDTFTFFCKSCGSETLHTRTLTRKTAAELRRQEEEAALRNSIQACCAAHGFSCRFLYQSVVVSTPLADWSFDYHQSKKTLRHESTIKVNFKTGDYAKIHEQFRDRKMTCEEVIDYIARHEKWRAEQNEEAARKTET